jgi:hypothetical protein
MGQQAQKEHRALMCAFCVARGAACVWLVFVFVVRLWADHYL